jgi:glycosyltransferase involved in cell wall biosynthesis
MIVKDEEHILGKTLANIVEHFPIADYCISDTGSTDTTVSIIHTFFESKGIPGHVFHDEWRDFAHNRNLNLEHARQVSASEYLLTFDADDWIEGTLPDLPKLFREHPYQVYSLTMGDTVRFERPILFLRDAPFHFVGVLHEYL